MFDIDSFKWGKLQAIDGFCKRYGLVPGRDCQITLRSHQWYKDKPREYVVEIIINDLKDMDPDSRRQLKRDYKLEVPAWAIGTQSPPLNCVTKVGTDDYPVTLDLNVQGAYECVARGEEECEPPEYLIKEADKLEAMSAEEALAYLKEQAANKRKPTTRKTYTCRPV